MLHPPQLHDFAVGENHREAGHVAVGDAVLQAVRATRVLGNIAAEGTGGLGGGVRSIDQPVGQRCPGEIGIDDSGLHARASVRRIQFENPVHAAGADDHGPAHGKGSSTQSGSAPPGYRGSALVVKEPHHTTELRRRPGQNDCGGLVPILGQSIRLVDQKPVVIGQDRVLAHDVGKAAGKHLVEGHRVTVSRQLKSRTPGAAREDREGAASHGGRAADHLHPPGAHDDTILQESGASGLPPSVGAPVDGKGTSSRYSRAARMLHHAPTRDFAARPEP